MSELTEAWFEEAKKLKPDEKLYLQVMSKIDQTELARNMLEERENYSQVDPVHAAQITVSKVRKDGRFWVVLQKKLRAPVVGLIKGTDGKYNEVKIDPMRRRMLNLMLKDCLSRKEIEENLDGLTEEELEEFFPN